MKWNAISILIMLTFSFLPLISTSAIGGGPGPTTGPTLCSPIPGLPCWITPSSSSSPSAQNAVLSSLCSTYSTVDTAIWVLALLLMILGGSLYAASHILPGQSKGTLQGYGMGMIMGGIIGVIIAALAPYIFTLIAGNGVANALSMCP